MLSLIAIGFVVALGFLATWVYIRLVRYQTLERARRQVQGVGALEGRGPGALVLWLNSAGFRHPTAPALFIGAIVGGAGVGLVFHWVLSQPKVEEWLAAMGDKVAVGFGGLLHVFGLLGPVAVGASVALAPYLYVRMARRSRQDAMERELAITLELLATLAEAGYGFDAGIATIYESDVQASPLRIEFDVYRRDVQAGVARAAALRQLSARCDMPTISSFVGSLIQADIAGASVADMLRRQADDLRDRRKMQALIHSQALPVKLVFPLLACFLPGLFVATLGPALHQLVKVVDGALRQGQ